MTVVLQLESRRTYPANALLNVAGYQAPMSGGFYSTRHDARYSRAVVVHYPLHPFYGLGQLPVCRHYGVGEIKHVEVQVAEERQAVPIWMTNAESCVEMKLGFEPLCSLTSLLALVGMLQATGL